MMKQMCVGDNEPIVGLHGIGAEWTRCCEASRWLCESVPPGLIFSALSLCPSNLGRGIRYDGLSVECRV